MTDTKKTLKQKGQVMESLPNQMYKVVMQDDQREVLTTLQGKLRRSFVRIFPGDTVTVEFSPHDDSRGRITAKHNKNK